uniref:Ig-like domain-containing protein n=1 Tax=Lates calcarifer TaxID=8187 RepID=A0A4W6BTG2_LATCA
MLDFRFCCVQFLITYVTLLVLVMSLLQYTTFLPFVTILLYYTVKVIACGLTYGDNITDMVFFVKNIFNQKLNNLYDSRVGRYVGFGEYGMKNADHFNSQAWKMALRKAQVETLCRYNARLFRRSTLDRKGKLGSVISTLGSRLLHCSVVGFFPQEVRVSWLRDGVEVTTDVSSTDVLANGDWSFQLHSYLELILKRGERVTCRVDHSSLKESLEVDWEYACLSQLTASRFTLPALPLGPNLLVCQLY